MEACELHCMGLDHSLSLKTSYFHASTLRHPLWDCMQIYKDMYAVILSVHFGGICGLYNDQYSHAIEDAVDNTKNYFCIDS